MVGVVMGSASDWPTMIKAVEVLERSRSASRPGSSRRMRLPDEMFAYAEQAAGRARPACDHRRRRWGSPSAGDAVGEDARAVLGVPVASRHLSGQDSLLSMVPESAAEYLQQREIGEAGAADAALFAVAMLAADDADLRFACSDIATIVAIRPPASVLPPR